MFFFTDNAKMSTVVRGYPWMFHLDTTTTYILRQAVVLDIVRWYIVRHFFMTHE